MKLTGKILLFFFFALSSSQMAWAQSSMTDNQVRQLIVKEAQKGTSEGQIVTKLVQKGASMQQIRRVRDALMKEKEAGTLGTRATDEKGESSRIRVNNGQKRAEERTVNSRILEDDEEYASTYNRQDGVGRTDGGQESGFLNDSILRELREAEGNRENQVFGRNIFNQKELSFEPNMNVGTPSDYRLGPGDAVFVDVYGASQKSYTATVSPEGEINLEGFGPVQVAGMTVGQANAHLRSTLGSRYSGSRVKLTVGQTKPITVNVMGEVRVPGSYTLSAFSTVFNALYMAGGINDIGTLRNIKVYRNGRLISVVDVYDFLLNGKLHGNVRLAAGDVISVGPYDCLVKITGKVKRPMYYEMKSNESVGTLLDYAGGFTGDAYSGNIRLLRKKGGDLSVYSLDEFERGAFHVADGDQVFVDSSLNRYRNMVELKGSVFRPGMYQMDGSISTVRQLIEAAGGLQEDAMTSRGIIHRRRDDRTLEVVRFDIAGVLNHSVADIALKNEDVVFIPSNKDLQEERTLTIKGEVLYPGVYDYAENTVLEDLVLQAGGLKDAASIVQVDVARRIRNRTARTSGSQIAKSYTFRLKDGFVVEGEEGFVLEPFDEVYVRRSPGYKEQEHITIEGEVAFAGMYALTNKAQRLSDVVKAAGGLTKEAYAMGARLERKLTEAEKMKRKNMRRLANNDSIDINKLELGDVRSIGIRLDKAIANPGNDEWDLVLNDGDRLVVPQYNNTVTINGEVMSPNTVSYKKGADLEYYINSSGGYSQSAKKRKVFAVHMNGTVTRVRNADDIQPGCEIIVPAKEKRKGLSLAEIVSLGTLGASLAAVVATLITK